MLTEDKIPFLSPNPIHYLTSYLDLLPFRRIYLSLQSIGNSSHFKASSTVTEYSPKLNNSTMLLTYTETVQLQLNYPESSTLFRIRGMIPKATSPQLRINPTQLNPNLLGGMTLSLLSSINSSSIIIKILSLYVFFICGIPNILKSFHFRSETVRDIISLLNGLAILEEPGK
jgi:hypothetical protein